MIPVVIFPDFWQLRVPHIDPQTVRPLSKESFLKGNLQSLKLPLKALWISTEDWACEEAVFVAFNVFVAEWEKKSGQELLTGFTWSSIAILYTYTNACCNNNNVYFNCTGRITI